MGLVSFIKNYYYNLRFSKANKLVATGRCSEAEVIYNSLLGKHPQAAAKLVEYYHSASLSASSDDIVTLFRQAVALEDKLVDVHDTESYKAALAKFGADIYSTSERLFAEMKYAECSALLTALNESRCKSENSITLCCEADINILLCKIENVRFSNNEFGTCINSLKELCVAGRNIARAREVLIYSGQQLLKTKRYYVGAIVFEMAYGDPYNAESLEAIGHVVRGEDSEIPSTLLKEIIPIYIKPMVLSDKLTVEQATQLFYICWKRYSDGAMILDVLTSAAKSELRDALVAHILANHKEYIAGSDFVINFGQYIHDTYGAIQAIDLLEQITRHGYNVEQHLAACVHSLRNTISTEEFLGYLDRAQQLYPKSEVILSDKYDCAKQYADSDVSSDSHANNARAIAIVDSIIEEYKVAGIIKAMALCNIANREHEHDADKRIELATEATRYVGAFDGDDATLVRLLIKQTYHSAAIQYYATGQAESCFSMLHSLAEQDYTPALLTITQYRLSEINRCDTVDAKHKLATDAIAELGVYNVQLIATARDYCALWRILVDATLTLYGDKSNSATIAELERLLDAMSAIDFDADFAETESAKLCNQLIIRKYAVAKELELAGKVNQAIDVYRQINALEGDAETHLSALRLVICKLKIMQGNEVLQLSQEVHALLRSATERYKSEKEDIVYRYVLGLAKINEDKEALSLLAEYLPNELPLKRACEQIAILRAQAKLEDFNNRLEALKQKTMTSDEAIYVIDHIYEYGEAMSPILQLSKAHLSKYRAQMRSYVIFKLIDEGKYNVAFERMIQEHPDYLEDLTALRNIAIVCLNMAESGQISTDNYKEVIAVWLTSIYQERLFIKSLDYTSWDNQYNFTLQNTYGHYDEFGFNDLPDNVNFDNSEESGAVSIREVQRILLDRFEAAISAEQLHHQFFVAEKDSMDAFIALNLDHKCRLVAPYLAAKQEEVFESIADSLEHDQQNHGSNWEDVLSVGVDYGLDKDIYNKYKRVRDVVNKCKTAIERRCDAATFASVNLSEAREFSKLHSAFTSFVISKIVALSSSDGSKFQENFDFFIEVCKAVDDRAATFIFTKYVLKHVVGNVNEGNIDIKEASKYIVGVYMLDKNNAQVVDNLKTLITMLAKRNEENDQSTILEILNKMETFDPEFHRVLWQEYDNAMIDAELNKIVEQVNSNTMQQVDALEKIYAMYEKNPNNVRICENLATISDMTIFTYIINQGKGRRRVCAVLKKLQANISDVFETKRGKFIESYNRLWSQLSPELRLVLKGWDPTKTLNGSGYALKEGLDYLKSLGNVKEETDINSILGINNRIGF